MKRAKRQPSLRSLTGRRVEPCGRVWLVGSTRSSGWEGEVAFHAGWYRATRYPADELGARRKLINAVMLFNEEA